MKKNDIPVKEEIDRLRQQLNSMLEEQDVKNDEVQKLSCKLDKLILKYQNNKKE